jgi:hypothetical protein
MRPGRLGRLNQQCLGEEWEEMEWATTAYSSGSSHAHPPSKRDQHESGRDRKGGRDAYLVESGSGSKAAAAPPLSDLPASARRRHCLPPPPCGRGKRGTGDLGKAAGWCVVLMCPSNLLIWTLWNRLRFNRRVATRYEWTQGGSIAKRRQWAQTPRATTAPQNQGA